MVYIIVTLSIKLTTKHGSLAASLPSELKNMVFIWLSEDEIAEFLNKSEWNKSKKKENILLDGCYLVLIRGVPYLFDLTPQRVFEGGIYFYITFFLNH